MPKLQTTTEISKVNIDLNDKWHITTDRYNYILQRKCRRKTGKIYYTDEAYFNTIEEMIDSLLDKEIREAEAKSLRALKKEVEGIRNEILDICKKVKRIK